MALRSGCAHRGAGPTRPPVPVARGRRGGGAEWAGPSGKTIRLPTVSSGTGRSRERGGPQVFPARLLLCILGTPGANAKGHQRLGLQRPPLGQPAAAEVLAVAKPDSVGAGAHPFRGGVVPGVWDAPDMRRNPPWSGRRTGSRALGGHPR